MNEVPAATDNLKKLAQDYRDAYSAVQIRYQEMISAEDFLDELKQQEAALMNRFRLIQQQLIATLEEEELEKMLELSRVFDKIRIINQFAIQAFNETNQSEDNQVAE